MPEDVNVVPVSYLNVNTVEITTPEFYQPIPDETVLRLAGDQVRWIRLDKLLFEAKLASSKSEAARKIREGAVRVGDKRINPKVTSLVLEVPSEIVVSLGRKLCKVQIIL